MTHGSSWSWALITQRKAGARFLLGSGMEPGWARGAWSSGTHQSSTPGGHRELFSPRLGGPRRRWGTELRQRSQSSSAESKSTALVQGSDFTPELLQALTNLPTWTILSRAWLMKFFMFFIRTVLRFHVTIFVIISRAHSSLSQHGNGYQWTSATQISHCPTETHY